MKEEIKTIGILAIAVAIGVSFVLGAFVMLQRAPKQFGGVPQVPSYNTASTSVIAVGRQSSVTAMAQRGNRGGGIICNTNRLADAYIVFSATTVQATTSASHVILGRDCLKLDNNPLYTGQVEVILSANDGLASSTAATSTSLMVTEFIGY